MPFHSGLESLRTQLGLLVEKTKAFVADKPLGTGITVLGTAALIPATIAGISSIKRRRKKSGKRRRKTKKTGRRKTKKGKRHRVRHLHRTSARGKSRRHKTGRAHHTRRGSKAIHFTKKGQPYIILANGRARFVTKRGARASKRRKGGRF